MLKKPGAGKNEGPKKRGGGESYLPSQAQEFHTCNLPTDFTVIGVLRREDVIISKIITYNKFLV